MSKNRKFWEVRNQTNNTPEETEEVELKIYGEIVSIPCWDGEVSANSLDRELKKYPNAKRITVKINSPGGDVFEAQAIHNILKTHGAEIITRNDALSASAATIINEAGSNRQAFSNSILMYHNPWTYSYGEAKDLRKTADMLDTVKETIINVYEKKAKMEREEISVMMDDETWLTAQEALERGFIDEIIDEPVKEDSIEEVQNFMKGPIMDKFKNFPTGKFKNMFKATKTATIQNQVIEKQKEEKVMNKDQLKKEHPELYNSLAKEFETNASAGERERIKNILNLSRPGAEEIIKNAIENGKSAGDTALDICNNKSIQTLDEANKVLNQSKKESEVLDEVKNLGSGDGEENLEELEIVKAGIAAGNSVK